MTALDKKAAVAGTKTKDFIDDKIGNKVVCFVCMCFFFPCVMGRKRNAAYGTFYGPDSHSVSSQSTRELLQSFDSHQ